MESLRLKCKFLVDVVTIPEESLPRIINLAPVTLGLSLEENLKPTITFLKTKCNLSSKELGGIIVTCPSILSLSVKNKLEPCLVFLSKSLFISSPDDLGNLIKCTPRILLQGVETSLARKLIMMKDAIRKQNRQTEEEIDKDTIAIETADIFRKNPALLATTNSILKTRIKTCLKDPSKDIETVFTRSKAGRKRIFETTAQVSTLVGTDIQSDHHQSDQVKLPKLFDESSMTMSLTAHASGSTYPPENINQVRGKRKAGGIAIVFPQVCKKDNFFDFESAMGKSFGVPMPEVEGGSNPKNGQILVGFPFLRPSRNRCDLYACHGALKVVSQLLEQTAAKRDMQHVKVNIEIYTESSYAWKLLKDSTQLKRWGSLSSAEDFVYDGDGPATLANPDILFPLTKTMYRILTNDIVNRRREKVVSGDVNIKFHHIGDSNYTNSYIRQLNDNAKKSAKWHFNKW